MSKGDKPRPFNRKRWDEEWERLYGAKKSQTQQVQKPKVSLRKRKKV